MQPTSFPDAENSWKRCCTHLILTQPILDRLGLIPEGVRNVTFVSVPIFLRILSHQPNAWRS